MRRIVLIVEDSPLEAPSLEIALDVLPGVKVEYASTGRAALDYLKGASGAQVCAVLTDLNMPVMDGYELIRRMRSDECLLAIPVIVLSGDSDPDTSKRALAAGADAYFPKPYSPIEVRKRLEQLLHARQP
jgi:CheY-like chemotaxis protein